MCGNDLEYYRAISPWALAEAAVPSLRAQRMLVRHAVGTADDTHELNRLFRERMAELGIAHAWIELAGIGHDPRAVLEELARVDGDFYRQALAQAAAPTRP